MCVNPRIMNNGVSVACRKCWQCRQNRINDWVGRCIAESKTAYASNSVTLTYGPDEYGNVDHERTAVLTYSDVQKYLKKLRFAGFPVRYFGVGEFGSAKGRAHWHLVLFWQDKPPPHEIGKRFDCKYWTHGYSHWDEVNAPSIRYVCKYIQKDFADAERQQQMGMSKKPPLGAEYFEHLAYRYVEQGIAPQVPTYHFPDVLDDKGETVKFHLAGATLDLFIARFLQEWGHKWGGHPPSSALVSDYCDRVAKRLADVVPTPFKPAHSRPWITPPHGEKIHFSKPHNTWYYEANQIRQFWSFDLEGKRAWQSVIRTESQAELLREAFEKRSTSETYRDRSRGK